MVAMILDGNFGFLTMNVVSSIVRIPIKDQYWPPIVNKC